MADTNKIFKSLRQYAVNPPPEIYPGLLQNINSLPQPDKALLQSILDNTDKSNGLTETEEEFTALQSYIDKENIPPPFDLQKIKEALAESGSLTATPRGAVAVRWLYRAVAAAILITGIVLIYVNTGGHKETTIAGGNEGSVNTNLMKKEQVERIKDSSTLIETKSIAVITKNGDTDISQQQKQTPVAAGTGPSGTTIPSNDFFYTLTNFTTTEAAAFFSGLQKDKKVTVNNYCYVNISDEMASILKQSYAVNRRNKYTWKARRMRARLNRWKNADEKYFDNENGKDPLDITDLSEFLFKNK